MTTLADLDGGVCGSPCSLRQAINAANTTVSIDGSGDVIHLPAGTLKRNPAFGAVKVTAAVVIVGSGARTTTIAGSPNPGFSSRALSVASTSPIDVELRDLSVADGLAEGSAGVPAEGGGIYATGAHLTLRRVTVRDNQALDARGPAVAGSAHGGGIFSMNGALTLEHVTIRDNRATGTWAIGNSASGGGASVRGAGTSIRNSTVAGNVADGGPGLAYAGGLELLASAQLQGVTVTGNRVAGAKDSSGGNISSALVPPIVSGSIIAGGRGTAPTSGNCARALTSRGGNVEDAGQCGFTSASDRADDRPGARPAAGQRRTDRHARAARRQPGDRPRPGLRGRRRPAWDAASSGTGVRRGSVRARAQLHGSVNGRARTAGAPALHAAPGREHAPPQSPHRLRPGRHGAPDRPGDDPAPQSAPNDAPGDAAPPDDLGRGGQSRHRAARGAAHRDQGRPAQGQGHDRADGDADAAAVRPPASPGSRPPAASAGDATRRAAQPRGRPGPGRRSPPAA